MSGEIEPGGLCGNVEILYRTALKQGAATLFASGQIWCGEEVKRVDDLITRIALRFDLDPRAPCRVIQWLLDQLEETKNDEESAILTHPPA